MQRNQYINKNIPTSQLEQELSKVNVILTETEDVAQVREWLLSDEQYQVMSQSVLTVLEGKKSLIKFRWM